MSAHDHLEHIEKASVDELRHLQLERLKWTLRHAYDSVPHYRKKFDAHGVRPDARARWRIACASSIAAWSASGSSSS